jgi:hypothetical protein
MRLPTILAAALLATSTLVVLPATTFAQVPAAARAAPGPLVGAGPVGLVVAGVGFSVYWLVKRRRRADQRQRDN